MKVGDLVECKLEIYGIGIVVAISDARVTFDKKVTVQWSNPPAWLWTGSNRTASHKPENLETI